MVLLFTPHLWTRRTWPGPVPWNRTKGPLDELGAISDACWRQVRRRAVGLYPWTLHPDVLKNWSFIAIVRHRRAQARPRSCRNQKEPEP